MSETKRLSEECNRLGALVVDLQRELTAERLRLSDVTSDAEELANALRDVLAGHPVRNADELIARYSPLPEAPK